MNLPPNYQRLQSTLATIGWVVPGTLRKVSLRCGKAQCRCQGKDPLQKHGPYFFWDRKTGGKLSSKSLSPGQAKMIHKGIQNRKRMEKILRQLMALGEKTARNLPP